MRTNTAALCLLMSLLLVLPTAADDSDIFVSSRVQPNILILFDTSGSMRGEIDGERKVDIAKRVIGDMIANVSGVRFGVMGFRSHGASMIAPIGTDTATLIDAVQNIDVAGRTPLGDALYEVGQYYGGNYPPHDSPIELACQQNFVVLMTDGLPNDDSRDPVSNVAGAVYATDHSALSGLQNVIVHTIGFAVPEGADLLSATAAAGGGEFYTAGNSNELGEAFLGTLEQIIEQTVSFTAPLIPSTSAAGGDQAYLASFEPASASPMWRGFLAAYSRDSNGRVPVNPDGTPLDSALVWEAGQVLANTAPSTRSIFTAIGGVKHDFVKTNASISPALLGVGTASERDAIIDFTRGLDGFDADGDGDTDEERGWKLGDIYHSNPVLVFPPPLVTADASYEAFRAPNASRATIVLAGGNDGMVHAFHESDGRELWSFIPPDQLSRLKNMGVRVGSHVFSMDGSVVVADVKIAGAWRTVAVFGERMGGGSYHALDITDTSNPAVMWSFSDAAMGQSWSEPAIGRIKLSGGAERAVAFVGGGYDDSNVSGKAFLVIDLSNGQKLWEYSNDGTADSQYMNFSLASAPVAVDLDNDRFVDRVYIGDVGGQIWKFDVSATGVLAAGEVTNWTGKRLFAADPAQANPPAAGEYFPAQGIYAAPALAFDPFGELWVFQGTGDRNNPNDSSQNRFYGVKDDTGMGNGSVLTESALADVTSSDATSDHGWFFRLGANEKVLSRADVFNGTVLFSTYTPVTTVTCESQGGRAELYAVSMQSGYGNIDWSSGETLDDEDSSSQRSETVGSGIASRPTVIMDETGAVAVVGTTEEQLPDQPIPSRPIKQIRYWREVM